MTENDILLIDKICAELGLGAMTSAAIKVHGGYMHDMYRASTEKGDYAIKLLNPKIMEQSYALDNYRLADELERKLSGANIPIVPSLELDGQRMQCCSGRYYYVFNWINGNALKSDEIRAEHCRITGAILARIHKIDLGEEYYKDEMKIDWDNYIRITSERKLDIASLLIENRELLYRSEREGNAANKKFPRGRCICHGDMDCKNVLWIGTRPYIIDLECLNYGNPFLELFELALCWSGYELCSINYDLLETFITAYNNEFGDLPIVDWEALYYSNCGRLDWLEYNVKRALMIGVSSEEERLLGVSQVKVTIEHIIYYDKIKDALLARLSIIDNNLLNNKRKKLNNEI